MRVLSPILHRAIYPALGAVGYFHSRAVAPVTVITYHGVLPAGYVSEDAFLDNTLVTEGAFRSQLRLLKKHYNVISPDEFWRWFRQGANLPERAVLLTCDDGLLNHLNVMVPILREEKLKCLFFVTGSFLESTPSLLWYIELYLLLMQAPRRDEPILLQGISVPEISADPGQRRVLWLRLLKKLSQADGDTRRSFLREAAAGLGLRPSWRMRYLDDRLLRHRFQLFGLSELKQLADAQMTIGAHSLSHPMLAEQSEELARAEIAECRKALEESLGRQVWAIAYPFGDPSSVGPREFKLAEEAGYDCGFVNVGGVFDTVSSRYSLPRVHVTGEMSLSVYEAYVSGFHERFQAKFRGSRRGG
jgi:peptidoglycan/xylan/chitin deacetylase (PgdA/CDA1 family)